MFSPDNMLSAAYTAGEVLGRAASFGTEVDLDTLVDSFIAGFNQAVEKSDE